MCFVVPFLDIVCRAERRCVRRILHETMLRRGSTVVDRESGKTAQRGECDRDEDHRAAALACGRARGWRAAVQLGVLLPFRVKPLRNAVSFRFLTGSLYLQF